MKLKKAVRNLIVGEHRYIESLTEFRQVMLSGQLAMIVIAILTVNCLMEVSLNWAVFTYVVSVLVLTTSIFCHRYGKHTLANFILLIAGHFIAYLFASSESVRTCICVFFAIGPISSFVLMNHSGRRQAVFFSILSFICFYLSYFVDFRILAWRNYTEDQILVIATVNMATAILGAGLGISSLIKLNATNARQLMENNRLLVKTNAELDRFVYSTSHDLRAPLTSVMGLINIAEGEDNIDELKHYLKLMKGRMDSMDSFIKDITDYSRNNRKEVGCENVNLKALAREVWEDLKFSPDAARIRFEVEIESDIEVESDRNRLKVILGNLISNSVRYHDARKEVQYIRLSYTHTSSGFYLNVEDNGQGIAEEYHHKIFEMFFRGNEASKGSGLGLYIVKETLGKLSGSISLNSQPGTGSSFTVAIPTAR